MEKRRVKHFSGFLKFFRKVEEDNGRSGEEREKKGKKRL